MPDAFEDVLQISFDALPLDDDAESEDEFSPDERFQVVNVEGEERISGLFEYEVIFEEPIAESEGEVRAAPALPIDELTGTDITLSFHRGDHTVRYVNGIVARLVHDHTSSPGAASDRQRYRVKIRPELWLLTLTNDYRSFSGKTVPDIVATILDDYQIPYDEDSLDENLKDRYRPRKHVVQSGESTFEFIDGLLEEAGVFYFFRQQAGFHTIVFGDDNMAFPDAPLGGENASVLRMGTSDQNDEETLWTGALEENVVPDGHRIGDTHFDGSTTVQQREGGDGAVDRKGRPLDVVDYPGGADRATDDSPREHGPEILRRRLQQHQASKRLLRGIGPVRGLGTGHTFELTGHDHGPINETEFVTRRLFVEASPSEGYQVEYEAFPASTRFRGYRYADLEGPQELGNTGSSYGPDNSAARSPRRRASQPQFEGSALALHLAEVVDASGVKKEKGNVKVDFDWSTEDSSDEVWARLAQFSADPSAGQSWGSQFVPRPGTKVLVAHEQGVKDTSNMDPIVLGCLYQGANKLPYPNDGETEIFSSIRSHSERGDDEAVHNEIRFVDEENQEEIGTFAPHKKVDAVGFEEDLQGAALEVKIHELEESPSDFIPNAARDLGRRILPAEYDEIPESEEKAEYRLTSEAKSTTNLPFGDYNEKIRYKKNVGDENAELYQNLDNKSVFYLKNKYNKKHFNRDGVEKVKSINKYLDLSTGGIKYNLKSIDSGDDSVAKNIENKEEEISYNEYDSLNEKTEYETNFPDPDRPRGFGELLDANLGYGKRRANIYVVDVTLGKDAYEKPSPTRDCYELRDGSVGKDVYEGPSATQDAYSEEKTKEPLSTEDAEANRIGYTTGKPEKDGVFEACNGSYRIHVHGPRLEIYRADTDVDTDGSDDSSDFFDQEFSEDWAPEGPGELDRFDDDDSSPIVILNQDGGISIRADEGINMEAGGDINIQSGGSIQMRADENVSCYADDEMTHYGRDILIGKRRGGSEISNNINIKSKIFKNEMSTGTLIADVYNKNISSENRSDGVVYDDKKIVSGATGVYNSQKGVSNTQTLFSHANTVIGISGDVVKIGGTVFELSSVLCKISQDVFDVDTEAAEMKSNAAEMKSALSVLGTPLTSLYNSVFKKSK